MDCMSSINTTQSSPVGVRNQTRGAILGFSTTSRNYIFQSQNLLKPFGSPKSGLNIYARRRSQPLIVAVAKTEHKGFKNSGVRTPLEPTSPEGRFLTAVLQNNRHLFSFAVSQQLAELVSNRDESAKQKIQSPNSMNSILHKRIADIKEKERQTAVEDVIYMSIVHKFSEIGVPMVPKLSEFITDSKLELSPSRYIELESIHSPEVQEMVSEHVARVLSMRGKSFLPDGSTTTKIDRLDLGRIYATSVMYAYFLKSAALKRQMDTSLGRTHENLQLHGYNNTSAAAESYIHGFQSLVTVGQSTDKQLLELCHKLQSGDVRPENLKSFVIGFDAQSLQRCAKLKSQEAVNVVEKHTWALFGDDKIGESDSNNEIVIAFSSLERLVLEAATFGTFLWDVETSVDSTYTLKIN